AVEARVYAEDAAAGFLPTGGRVLALALPRHVRVDHALEVGTVVSSSYDPMLAKVIAHAPTRAGALAAQDRAPAATHVLGVVTNTAFLRALLALDEVVDGELDTGLIERRLPELAAPPVTARTLAVAALLHWDQVARSRPDDLWQRPTGWRLGAPAPFVVRLEGHEETPREIALTGTPQRARARIGEEELELALHPGAVTVDGRRLPLTHHCMQDTVWVGLPGEDRELTLHRRLHSATGRQAAPTLGSPMPGTVTTVLVADGDRVRGGDPVLVVEAMKMEHPLHAPGDGTVQLHVAAGHRVARGEEVAQLVPEVIARRPPTRRPPRRRPPARRVPVRRPLPRNPPMTRRPADDRTRPRPRGPPHRPAGAVRRRAADRRHLRAPPRPHPRRGGQRPALHHDHEPAGPAPRRGLERDHRVRAAPGELDAHPGHRGRRLGRADHPGHPGGEPRLRGDLLPPPAAPRRHALQRDHRARRPPLRL